MALDNSARTVYSVCIAMDGKTIGLRVKALRERKRWSQRTLADEAGVSSGYVALLERGGLHRPGVEMAERLARALGWTDYNAMMATDALEPAWVAAPSDVVPARLLEPVAPTNRELAARLIALAERLLGDDRGGNSLGADSHNGLSLAALGLAPNFDQSYAAA